MIRPSCSASSPKRCWRVTRGSNLGPIRSSTSCLAGRVQRQDRIIVTLPASEITDGVAENLHLALRRYCEARLTLVQRKTRVAWRQGLSAATPSMIPSGARAGGLLPRRLQTSTTG